MLKKLGNIVEYEAMRYLEASGYKVYRVPMSLLPFDILAINPKTNEVLFVEVKRSNGRLSKRQEKFRELINSNHNWKVSSKVMYKRGDQWVIE